MKEYIAPAINVVDVDSDDVITTSLTGFDTPLEGVLGNDGDTNVR